MKILVTGGAGFIGSHITDLLIGEGHNVFVADNLSSGKKENVNLKTSFFLLDLREYEKINELFEKEKFDVVYHCAAQINVRKSVADPLNDAQINILASLNLLELCVKHKIKHFIFSSTGGAIYGDEAEIPSSELFEASPVSPYGCAKLAIEKYLNFYNKIYGLKFSCLRYANVYGPRQDSHGEAGVIAVFFDNMFHNKNPVIFGGIQTRDFVYVEDVARANLLALRDKKSNTYNVGTGKETDIIRLFYKMNNLFGSKFEAEYKEKNKGEQLRSCLCYDRIKKNLGWGPETKLDDGLEKSYFWFFNKINKGAI